MMAGSITKRGKSSWRIKFDLDRDPVTGARRYHTVTVKGSKKDAEIERARLLNDLYRGTLIETTVLTVERYLWQWLEGKRDLATVTRERYADSIKVIATDLGKIELQKLK